MESDEAIQEAIFPYELEELIFTEAARLSPSSARNFMLVAHRVHQWVAHTVYRICSQLAAPYFPDTRNPTPSLQYFGPFVKHLIIGGYVEEETIKLFFESCTNLVDLALWTSHPTKCFLHLFENLKLQRLSTDLCSLDEADFKGPYLSLITHLDVTDLGEELERWKALENLPALTHLAINNFVDEEPVRYLLKHCSKLRILLVIQGPPRKRNTKLARAEIYDPRFVMMNISRFIVTDWENGANGEEDFWTCAESISAAKHRAQFHYSALGMKSDLWNIGRSFRKADFCTWFSRNHWRKDLDALEQAYSSSS